MELERVTADGLNISKRPEFADGVARSFGNLVRRIVFDQIVNPRATFRAWAGAAQGVKIKDALCAVAPIDLQKTLCHVYHDAVRFDVNCRAHFFLN